MATSRRDIEFRVAIIQLSHTSTTYRIDGRQVNFGKHLNALVVLVYLKDWHAAVAARNPGGPTQSVVGVHVTNRPVVEEQ